MENRPKTIIFKRGDNNINQELRTNDYFLLDSSSAIGNCIESDINEPNSIFLRYYDEEKKNVIEKRYKIDELKKLYDFNYIMEDGNPVGFLLPKKNFRNQNKIDFLTKEIKNPKYNNELLRILKLDLNKVNFDLKETKFNNILILNKNYDNHTFVKNNFGNNNITINNNQNRIDSNRTEIFRKPNDQLNNNFKGYDHNNYHNYHNDINANRRNNNPINNNYNNNDNNSNNNLYYNNKDNYNFNNNYQQNYNLEIINLRNELNKKNQIIEKQKIQINNLQNQIYSLNNIINNNKLSIQNLRNNINIKDQEIFNLNNKNEELNKLKLNNMIDKEQQLAINFMSVSHDKIFPIICLKNDSLVKYEEIFYNEYPEYKDYNTYLTANGNPIKRFKTIKENGIKQGSAIIVNIYE